jgi:UDP:flavonoid glycosyltransferase YjiC (YdhE family)
VSEGLAGLSVAGLSVTGSSDVGLSVIGVSSADVWVRDVLGVAGAPDVIGIGSPPHEVLFPRCAAVVHHGGAGTTAAAVRAGVPQVIVPHAADQPYWGRRMADLGVAADPIARKDLTPERLQRALEFALSPEAREAAYRLGERVRGEDGAGDAARLVDAYLALNAPGSRRLPRT